MKYWKLGLILGIVWYFGGFMLISLTNYVSGFTNQDILSVIIYILFGTPATIFTISLYTFENVLLALFITLFACVAIGILLGVLATKKEFWKIGLMLGIILTLLSLPIAHILFAKMAHCADKISAPECKFSTLENFLFIILIPGLILFPLIGTFLGFIIGKIKPKLRSK